MASLQVKNAVGRITFVTGTTPEGKLMTKMQTYRNIHPLANADQLYQGLHALANLSTHRVFEVEKIESFYVEA